MDIDLSNKVVAVFSYALPKRRDLKSYTFQREDGKILSYNRALKLHNRRAGFLLWEAYLVFVEPYIPAYHLGFKGRLGAYCVAFKPHEEIDLLLDDLSKFFSCSIVKADLNKLKLTQFPDNVTSKAISDATFTFMSEPSISNLKVLMSIYMGYDAESTPGKFGKVGTYTWPGMHPTLARMAERRKFEKNYRTFSKVTNIPSSVRRIATVTNTTILKDREPLRLDIDATAEAQPVGRGIRSVMSRMTVTVREEEENADSIEDDSKPPRLEHKPMESKERDRSESLIEKLLCLLGRKTTRSQTTT